MRHLHCHFAGIEIRLMQVSWTQFIDVNNSLQAFFPSCIVGVDDAKDALQLILAGPQSVDPNDADHCRVLEVFSPQIFLRPILNNFFAKGNYGKTFRIRFVALNMLALDKFELRVDIQNQIQHCVSTLL